MNLLDKGKYNHSKVEYQKSRKKYFEKPVSKIMFVHDYSVKSDELNFTNFFERITSTRNKIIKEVIQNCIQDPSFFTHYFIGDEVSLKTKRDISKRQRLHKIIALYNNFQADDDKLFKYVPNALYQTKYNTERGLQFIFEHKNNTLFVYLIDLYHLAIRSRKDKNQERMSLSYEYENKKKFNKGIEEVIFNKSTSKS